ncbi:MAG: LexA family transcriptional regulator [Planctomycetes bacterium]|jgi:transcriptional regulator with XRE-family HTH domain|nr:LexA family transcriptional regulator [Planctomycetota bacterium]
MATFADHLREARRRSGLTQTDLAERAGLTGSYISLLESGKKPPPSDRVLSRLSRALGVPESDLAEVAHLDRTPEDVRQKILALSRRLERERRLTHRMLAGWLTFPSFFGPFLRAGDPLISRRLGGKQRQRLEKLLRRLVPIATGKEDSAEEVQRFLSSLPDEDREILAVALPEIALPRAAASSGSSSPAGPGAPPPVLSAPPPPGDREVYHLRVGDDDMAPRLEPGDILTVDPAAAARPGDLVLLRRAGGFRVRQLVASGRRLTLTASNPRVTPEEAAADDLAGVVLEVRRVLR